VTGSLACNDSSGPSTRRVTLDFQASAATQANVVAASAVGDASAATASSADLVITRGSDNLVISSAQLVVRNVKLQPAGENCIDDTDDDTDVVDDECAAVFTGPFLVDLLANTVAGSELSVELPEGTYNSVQFRIHKVNSNKENERAFREANPDFVGISVRIEGTFNGAPFVFTDDLTQNFKLNLPSPIVVDAESENVAVVMDIGQWFTPSSGAGLMSPIAMSNQTKQAISQNIRAGIRAFQDNNHDGNVD
jgi:hypothetical protein